MDFKTGVSFNCAFTVPSVNRRIHPINSNMHLVSKYTPSPVLEAVALRRIKTAFQLSSSWLSVGVKMHAEMTDVQAGSSATVPKKRAHQQVL